MAREILADRNCPSGHIYNFVLFKARKPKEINQKLLESGISVRLIDKYLRITAGSEDENDRLIEIMKGMTK
jgi:histidinol-phosphate/aromatic aminotransferase/cobyric acid decarboxylase-like protein